VEYRALRQVQVAGGHLDGARDERGLVMLPDPLVVGHIGRQGLPSKFLPVRLYQNPGVVSLISSSRATSAIVRGGEESTTFLTACSLNSGV
jgi:hypothetical protein